MNLYGCFALVAGAAGGAGTAAWLSGKVTQQFERPYERTVTAAREALRALDLPLSKEVHDDNITQLRSEYTDGREIWVDIKKVTSDATRVDVRVGGVNADKAAATRILEAIANRL